MIFIKKSFAFLKISRPLNSILTFFVIVVASFISADDYHYTFNITLGGISGALTASAGNIINDYFDINIDRINKPKRALPAKLLSLNEALTFYIILTVASLIIASFININSFIIVFIASTLLFFYSYHIKKIPLLGNIIVSFVTGLAFIYGGVIVNNIPAAIIPALFAFLINFIREIVKDMEDTEGDKHQGIKTYPIAYGYKKTKRVVVFITIVLIILTLYPFVFRIYTIEYFLIVMILVNPFLVYILQSLYDDDSVKNLHRLSNFLKLNMIIGLIAIFLGK